MGQTLLRELADVGKRLEHEKTQRCFVQGCGHLLTQAMYMSATCP